MNRQDFLHRLNYLILFGITGIFLIIIAPFLWPDGMFVDGLQYATISRNLANGLGTFWNPHLTNTLYPEFHEHPSLAFAIQSVFFKLLGDSIYTERVYSLLTLFAVGIIIFLIWKQIGEEICTSWIPLLFYFSMPLILWSFSSNMLENTLSIFCELSVLFYLKSLEKSRLLFLLLSGLAIFAGLLIKGPFALFPLTLPIIYWILKKDKALTYAAADTAIILFVILIPVLYLIFFNEQASESLTKYFERQVIGSLQHVKTVNTRFYILGRFLSEIVPPVLIVLSMLLYSKIKFRKTESDNTFTKYPFIFISLGLAGIVPVMISLKQREFYIVPALPFIAIGFALFIKEKILKILNEIKPMPRFLIWLKFSVIIVIVISVFMPFTQVNKIKRKKEKVITDICTVLKVVPANSDINISPDLYNNWGLHGYFARYANVSLEPDLSKQLEYLLLKSGSENNFQLKNYRLVELNLASYKLYRINE